MKRRLLTFAFVLILTFGLVIPAAAQSYSFSLDKEVVHVYWNADGTMSLDYTWVFKNQPGAHVIDFVDVGMPNGNFDMSTITADVNGNSVNVSQSDYQGSGSGFAVVMGSQTIASGASGTVHVYVGRITDVLYPDTSDNNYASGDFAPTYFGSQYVSGSTDLTVAFHLPPDVKPEEPRWHAAPSGFPSEPQAALDSSGRVIYTWYNSSASPSTQYTFGASFPKSYVPDSAIVQTNSLEVFFGLIAGLFSFIASSLPCLIIIALFFGIPIFGAIQGQRRKLKYLPPRISIEGHGIKRGLTAVEAAILTEQPLDKVMTMILFGVVKKNAAAVITRNPLALQVTQPLPEGLQGYEKDFLTAFAAPDLAARRKSLQEMTVNLVKSVSEKMKGFSRKETMDYYKSIMERAWRQIEAAGTPDVKSQMYDEALEWTMLDKNYDERTRRVFTGPIFVPMWWGRYDPAYRPVTTGAPKMASVTPTISGGRTSLPGAAFAASVVGGVQNFSSKVIGDLTGFTNQVTQRTNPLPKSTSSGGWKSSGGGGGHSCACACACAGCACACAGGGR